MYVLNDVIRALGESVIAEHEELAHLKHPVAPCRIAYMYSDKDKSHRGRTVYADTTKVSEMMQALTSYDFVITFYGHVVDDLPEAPLRILMYHELLHIGYDPETEKRWLIPHDVEDFERIITRYGLYWLEDAQQKQEA